jgi:tetratricopeptide (TPR) repeat protein
MAYQDGKDDAFDAARTIASISLRADNSTQHELLTQVTAKRLSAVQRMKVAMLLRLSKQGTADQNWWNALGKDCIVGNQPDLARLEAGLAGAAAETLTRVLQSGTVTDIAALGTIAKCLNTCRSAAGHHSAPPVVRAQGDAIIDRDSDADSVVEFLERSREVVCLVVGLDAVGKSSVIRKALAQAGHRNVQSIPLAPDITPEFLAVRLLTAVDYPFANEADDPVAVLGEALPGRLARSSVWIIEDAGNLLSHVTWRDDRFTEVLRDLVRAAADAQAKIIVESNVSLDFPLDDPNQLKRVPIRGLAGEYAFGLLNQQLRRAGLEPGHYAQADRARIVEALGGHPGAIILAAEYVEKAGIEQVVKDITAREGVHAAIVRKIIRRLHLTEEEARVLALLAQARAPIPASVIAQVTSFNPMPVLQDLRKLALVERYENDRVAITGLLRGFGELPPPPPKDIEAFHLAAAIAFKKLSETADPSERLGWAVEARYHALTAGKPELAPDVGNLADGALGALSNFVDRNAYEAALPLADELLIFHRTAEVLELAAIVYSRLGKCEDALVLAKEAVAQQPHRAWILTEVGRLSLNVHKVEVAEDALRLAKATGTDSTFIAVLEGKVALRKRDIEAAIAAFRRGVVMSQYDGWPHFYLGRTLIEQGRVQEAVEVLHTGDSVENNRRHSRRNVLAAIRTQLVLAYLHMDDLCNAERWLGVVADEDPGSPEVARAFAYLRVKQGDPDVARKALQDLDPSRARNRHERAQIHLFRGLFFVGMGLRERASEEFNQSNLADSQNVFVLLRWAETLLEMAREAGAELEHEAARICAERAREVAGKVLEFDADNSQALAILELLYDLFNVG